MRIAVLEDNEIEQELTRSVIQSLGYLCYTFSRGESLLRALRRDNFDLLILDWNVPGVSAIEVLKWARTNIADPVPVLFISSHIREQDIVQALMEGADDYLAKPVRISELRARITALLRRAYPQKQQRTVVIGDFVFDRVAGTLHVKGKLIELKHKERELAYFLFINLGRLLSRKYLLESVWGLTADCNSRTLNTHISNIRAMLNLKPENGFQLTSLYGVGYRLEKVSVENYSEKI